MKCKINFSKRLLKNEEGATAIEYGLLAALIAVVIIGAVSTLGQTLETTFNDVNNDILTPPAAADADAGDDG